MKTTQKIIAFSVFSLLSTSVFAESRPINHDLNRPSHSEYRQVNGIIEYPREIAKKYEPSKEIEFRKSFTSVLDAESFVAEEAKKQGFYAFNFRYLEIAPNRYKVSAKFFEKDAKERTNVNYDDLPAVSGVTLEGKTEKSAISQKATSTLQKVKEKYAALPQSEAFQPVEINKEAAKKLTPFKSYTFKTDRFALHANISERVRKKATELNAIYYHFDMLENLDKNRADVIVKFYK